MNISRPFGFICPRGMSKPQRCFSQTRGGRAPFHALWDSYFDREPLIQSLSRWVVLFGWLHEKNSVCLVVESSTRAIYFPFYPYANVWASRESLFFDVGWLGCGADQWLASVPAGLHGPGVGGGGTVRTSAASFGSNGTVARLRPRSPVTHAPLHSQRRRTLAVQGKVWRVPRAFKSEGP